MLFAVGDAPGCLLSGMAEYCGNLPVTIIKNVAGPTPIFYTIRENPNSPYLQQAAMQIGKWPHFWILGSMLLAQERQGFVFVLPKTPNNGVFSALGGTLLVTDFLIGPEIVHHGKFKVTDFLVTNFLLT